MNCKIAPTLHLPTLCHRVGLRHSVIAAHVFDSNGNPQWCCTTTFAILACPAGVGKGRQIAGTMKAMVRKGKTKRILWLSHNNDLREDARRDMVDMCGLLVGTPHWMGHTCCFDVSHTIWVYDCANSSSCTAMSASAGSIK